MKNKESVKILAAYLKKLYVNDLVQNIYKKIITNLDYTSLNAKDISKLFSLSDSEEVIDIILNDIKKNEKNILKLDFDINNITKKFNKELDKKKEYVFEKMTFPLYLFIEKLYFSLIKNKAQKVYFFAREGEFLQKLFDTYQKYIIGPKIKSEYLYVSRASTFLGTLKDLKKEDFTSLFHQYPNMSIEVFCQNLSFNKEEIAKLTNDLKIDMQTEIINLKESKEFQKLLNNSYFRKLYDEKRTTSRNNFLEYLSSFGSDYLKEMHVVDVGWKGSIQSNIQKIIPNTKVIGYYLGLVNYEEIKDYDSKKAILFENTPYNKTLNCYLYNSNRSIFEMLLGASHGSTINYAKINNKIEPVLNNLDKELKMFKEKIKPIQDNIFNKFKKLLNILNSYYYNDLEKKFNQQFFDLIFNPTKEELETYNSFYHFENFGIMVYSTFDTKKKLSFKEKLKNYRHFRSFISYDDHWQYLKLYNYGMHFGKIILYWYKWITFKKNNVI